MLKTQVHTPQSITLLIKEKDLSSVKAILKFLKEKFPRFSIQKFTTGKIGEDILVSFRVNGEYYTKVLEKFAYNEIPIIMNDKKSIDFVEKKKDQKRKKLRTEGWSDISRGTKQMTLSELIRLSEKGKIKEIVKEAKGGVSSNYEIVKKAKSLLSQTITVAIENLIYISEEKYGRASDAIEQLILIATDKELKLLQKNNDMDKAGVTAIEISRTHKNYYHFLVELSNNSKLNNITNVKAAISLAELIFAETENKFTILEDVIKKLNTRWLKIAYDTVQQKLSSDESNNFNNLIDFIEEKRQAA